MVSRKVFVTLLWLVNCCACWVFTEVQYPLAKTGADDNDFGISGDELSPEEREGLLIQGKLSLIYPGTKWCGAGDVAENYDDLGHSMEADMCCREHDHCPDTIPAGETKHNLTNTAYFTKRLQWLQLISREDLTDNVSKYRASYYKLLGCKCDEDLRQCLHKANTTTANSVGVLYFNVIGAQCFRNDYPIIGCAKKAGWLTQKCVEYIYDKNGEKRYQFFEVPNY